MSSVPTAEEIARNARWLAQALDPAADLVRLIDMSPESYRSASFLDDRLLQQPVRGVVRPWAEVAAAVDGQTRTDARWIFHIGHVGSTMIARMIGELPGVLSIREPRILRDVATEPPGRRPEYLPALQRLFSRTFDSGEAAVVKATSFVSEIAAELVPQGEKALFVATSAQTYIATILAGPNSRVELQHLAQSRRERLAGRGISFPDSDSSDAHRAAAAWACEMTALESAASALADGSVQWCDFDDFLDAPEQGLTRVARFFGFQAPEERVRAVVTGPLMRRYSKALEYEYSPELRAELIREASAAHRETLAGALAMLEGAAENSPLLASALAHSKAEA
jgi:hypothetical protein